jgi:tRNA A37 threonylcarbamoyladenosine dehydratase
VDRIYQRTSLAIGEANLEKLKHSNVCICGIGGVGSYTLEALARVGIGRITIIDNDTVDITNVNRQLIATVDNVGKPKI